MGLSSSRIVNRFLVQKEKKKEYAMRHLLAALITTTCLATPAGAAVIYSEDFDGLGGSFVLNFNGFSAPLALTEGTVDYIRSGDFGINCVGGTGGCIDMDGSTSNGGTLDWTFNLSAGTYLFSFDFSGNQRSDAPDNGLIQFIAADPGLYTGPSFIPGNNILATDPFQTASNGFTLSGATTVTIKLADIGNDNIGFMIDNVRLEGDVAAVPEPGALSLLGLGLIGLGWSRRRA